jgi:hypothetical protein
MVAEGEASADLERCGSAERELLYIEQPELDERRMRAGGEGAPKVNGASEPPGSSPNSTSGE